MNVSYIAMSSFAEVPTGQNACAHTRERLADLRDLLTENGVMFAMLVVVFVGVIIARGFEIINYSGNFAYLKDGKLVAESFEFTITTEKATYKLQERIKMNVTLRNIGEENVTITFLTMPNPSPYWFWKVYDDSQQHVFYYKIVGMLPALEEITLQRGEFMQRDYAWDQKATDSGQQVPPGIYYLTAVTGFMYNGEEVKLESQLKILIEL
jgi:hypothetical protein